MMNIATGQTVYEQIISVNQDNIPITGATFDTTIYKDGLMYISTSVNIALSDAERGVYTASWSADTVGEYQLYVKNNSNSVIFISDNITVKSDSELSTNIYIGL